MVSRNKWVNKSVNLLTNFIDKATDRETEPKLQSIRNIFSNCLKKTENNQNNRYWFKEIDLESSVTLSIANSNSNSKGN